MPISFLSLLVLIYLDQFYFHSHSNHILASIRVYYQIHVFYYNSLLRTATVIIYIYIHIPCPNRYLMNVIPAKITGNKLYTKQLQNGIMRGLTVQLDPHTFVVKLLRKITVKIHNSGEQSYHQQTRIPRLEGVKQVYPGGGKNDSSFAFIKD